MRSGGFLKLPFDHPEALVKRLHLSPKILNRSG